MPAVTPGVLLDTSVLINLLHRRENTVGMIRDLTLRGFALAICPINIAEVYAGIRKGEEKRTEELFSGFQWLPLTREIARKAGEIVSTKRRGGRTHALDDMIIAATAIHYGYSLLTDNRKDFEVPEVRLFSE